MADKICIKCGGLFDDVFFRKNRHTRMSTRKWHRLVCIGCEQTTRDEKKIQDRWPAKIRDTIRRHASSLKISPESLRDGYGWDFERLKHDAQHAYQNGCAYCGVLYRQMKSGSLSNITLDIINPEAPPYYLTNTRWCCMTCNYKKGRTDPTTWSARQACWDKWKRLTKRTTATSFAWLSNMPLFREQK